jgi:hypothetical protein
LVKSSTSAAMAEIGKNQTNSLRLATSIPEETFPMQLTQGIVKPSKATMLATRPTVFQKKLLSSFACGAGS